MPPSFRVIPCSANARARTAYHYHANTPGKARVKSLSLSLVPSAARHRRLSLPDFTPLFPYASSSSSSRLFHPTDRPLVTSLQPTGHICKTCHYYNNITPMNLPLNARMHGLANYTPGGATRTDAGIERAVCDSTRCEGVNTIVSPRLSARVFFFLPFFFFALPILVYNRARTRARADICVRVCTLTWRSSSLRFVFMTIAKPSACRSAVTALFSLSFFFFFYRRNSVVIFMTIRRCPRCAGMQLNIVDASFLALTTFTWIE